MPDMLVKLYTLPTIEPLTTRLQTEGIAVRQAEPSEKYVVAGWVRTHFSESWAVGCEVALTQQPTSCYIATIATPPHGLRSNSYDLPPETLVGFACYDVASKGMFGAEGVHPNYRGRGIGTALLVTCLRAMAAQRYAYAIIGWAGPVDFYAKTVGATVIEGSEPGIFRGPLRGI